MIAFLGTGLLGANFSRALLTRGETVHVWNRSHDKAVTLESFGAKAFENVADAVRGAERVHLTLVDDAVVDEVLEKASAGLSKGVTLVDHTTTSADGARARVASWKKRGVDYLHAPVFMGPSNALAGTGTMMASGDKALFDSLAPKLETMTGRLIYLGDDPGRAAGLKLIGNQMIVSMNTVLADALALSAGLGIPAKEISTLLDFFNPGTMLPMRLGRILARDYDNPTWTLDMARKDVRLMIDGAADYRDALVALPAIAEAMDREIANGNGSRDNTIVTRRSLSS